MVYLSGLTCTEDNATQKAGAQRVAAELGLIFVVPDTSPRGDFVADDEAYELGQGAGFYVNATQSPWAPHFSMYDYITKDLVELMAGDLDVDVGQLGITGHSMGGHGALTIGLRHPELFKSISAFSPIVSPMNCSWGEKALTAYLGKDPTKWAAHDACELVKSHGFEGTILIDQGEADNFLGEQLKTHLFIEACAEAGVSANIRIHPGYDHSYFFIASFIDDHLRHHHAALTMR